MVIWKEVSSYLNSVSMCVDGMGNVRVRTGVCSDR